MIKIENIDTCNWEAAIRGMRNPMNSWDKSDTAYGCYPDNFGPYCRRCCDCHLNPINCGMYHNHWILGPNDLKLAKELAAAGSDHGKFLRMIIFSCDIVAPIYWWKEMDQYKVGTVRNSCSTMHKIMSKKFELDDFSYDHVEYELFKFSDIVNEMNKLRTLYMEKKNSCPEIARKIWYQLIQLLPSSYNQKATWTANYEVLRNIYHARKNHKLDEWHDFCDMIEELPYSELITEKR